MTAWASSKRASMTIIAICQVAAMALWFSASAVIPALAAEFSLSNFAQATLTSAVQVGFVIGCLVSAVLGPRPIASSCGACSQRRRRSERSPTRSSRRRSCVGRGAAVALVTGVCMAGVYPVGMKLAATWARGDMGLLVGILVGALTLGSALPHLFNALGGVDWRIPLAIASACALFGGTADPASQASDPIARPVPRFDPHYVLTGVARRAAAARQSRLPRPHVGALRDVGVDRRFSERELRAHTSPDAAPTAAKLAAFATIASGAIGCVAAGFLADRFGRTTLTIAAMAVSGSCAASIGLLFGGPAWALVAVCIVWGISIVADSAQFSASVAELADPSRVGTMLTLQTALGSRSRSRRFTWCRTGST